MSLKPSFPRLRRDHPLANGLIAAYECWQNTPDESSVVGQPQTLIGAASPGIKPSAWGPARSYNGTSQHHTGDFDASRLNDYPFSIVTAFRINALGDKCLASLSSTSLNHYLAFFQVGSRGWEYQIRRGGTTFDSTNFAVANGGAIDTLPHIAAMVSDSEASHSLYIDGVLIEQDTNTCSFPSPTRTTLAARRNQNTLDFRSSAELAFLRIYNRALGPTDLAKYQADPFAMFRPRTRSYFAFFADGAPPDPPTAPRRRQKPQLIGCGVI